MFIDILLLLLFIVITGLGFFQGTIRLLIAIIALYASVILSSLYFKSLSLYMSGSGTNAVVADAVSFFVILLVAFLILFSLSLYTFRYLRLPGRLEFLDRMLGVVLGVFFGVILTSLVAMILQYAFITHSAGDFYPLTRAIQRSTRSSVLRELLIFNILPRLYATVAPVLPDAALPFFSPGR